MAVPTPLPRIAAFEKLAYGMFIHWGLYAQMGQGEWIMHLKPVQKDDYNKLQQTFTAKDFDGRAIARTAREAGMRYITLTTRHHDGFSLYDTRGLSEFDAPHAPAGRDLIADFVEGCRAEGIVPFFYHTLLDWQWNSGGCTDEQFNEYLDYLLASVEILCKHYGDIGGLWFDGTWSRNADWKLDRLYAMIRKNQPEAMIINNTGLGERGRIGHPEVDSVTFEQGLPTPINREGHEKYIAGEMCQTMNRHWGLGKDDFDYMSPGQIIQNLCLCRKVGANYLLNVGPTPEGAIPEYETAALHRAGQWIEKNADAIYEGKPVACQCAGRDFVLETPDGRLFYFVFDLAISGHANVTVSSGGAGPRAIKNLSRKLTGARWLDNGETLNFTQNDDASLTVADLTGYPYGSNLVVRVAELDK